MALMLLCLPVMVHQHVDHILEQLRLLGTEVASLDLVNHLPQLRQTVIILSSIVPVNTHIPHMILMSSNVVDKLL